MAVIIRKSGQEILRIENIERIEYKMLTNAIEIPVPGESNPMIMQLGGVSRRIDVEWKEITSNIPSSISRIANDLMSGELLPVYDVCIEEWSITKNCVIFDLVIVQEAGQTNMFRCRISLAIGDVL